MRIILFGLLVTLALAAFMPSPTQAGSQVTVVITASPSAGNVSCPWGFAINAASLYELELSWNAGNASIGTMIRGAYARVPGNVTDGFEVYHGNETSFTHWVNTEFIGVDIYYRVYDDYGGGNYSTCYASGSVTGGESMAIIGSSMTLIGTAILAFLALGCMVTGYHFKNRLFMFGSVVFWIAFIGYSYINSASSGDTFYVLAGAGGMMMILSALFMFGGMRKDQEAITPPPEEKPFSFTDWQKTRGLKTKEERRIQRARGLYPWER